MLSRTAVADYAATVLTKGDEKQRQELVMQLAGWLKANGRRRQAKYLVSDIAKQLSERGYTLISVTTAKELQPATKQAILDYLSNIYGKDNSFEVIELIDQDLIGGALIETPRGILDLSVKNKLMTIIKGASV